jgi:hypothetical protein
MIGYKLTIDHPTDIAVTSLPLYLESSQGDSKGEIQSNALGGNVFDPVDDQNIEVGKPATVASLGGRTVRYRDILDATDELAKSVSNISHPCVKKQYLGEIIRLTEIVKGNLKIVEGMSLQYLLDGQLSVYIQSSAGQQISSQNTSLINKGHRTTNDETSGTANRHITPI